MRNELIFGYTYEETFYEDSVELEGSKEEVEKALKLYKAKAAKEHRCKVNEIFLAIRDLNKKE